MGIIATILYALVLSVDATTVAIANGFCYSGTIKHGRMIFVAAMFGVFQMLMPLIGYWTYYFFQEQAGWLDQAGTYIASALLALLGIKMIFEGIEAIRKNENIACDTDEGPCLSTRRIFVQAIATSIDALAVGVGISVSNQAAIGAQTNIWLAVVIIGVVTFATSLFGIFSGRKIGPFMKKYAPIIGGVVLVLLAINLSFEFLF